MRIIAVEEHYGSRRIVEAIGVPVRAAAELEGKLTDLGEGRIADMDAAGIDLQLLSLNSPGAQALTSAEAVPLVREENDRLAEAVRARPDRLAALASLPTADPEAAADELARAVRELGFRGGIVNGHTGGRFLDDRAFWPLLERAQALDVPLYLHPAPPPPAVVEVYYRGLDPEVGGALATSGWGWHVETGLQVLRLILSGAFDRFPRLQLVIGHMGEALPFMLARIDERLAPELTRLERPVSAYVRENLHLTTSGFFTFPPLLDALLEVGPERILFAVDYPFSPNQRGRAFLDSIPVSPADREKIAHRNAERLFRL
jgi:predicted TIM-barrel fold metal-dependent hydrolase